MNNIVQTGAVWLRVYCTLSTNDAILSLLEGAVLLRVVSHVEGEMDGG